MAKLRERIALAKPAAALSPFPGARYRPSAALSVGTASSESDESAAGKSERLRARGSGAEAKGGDNFEAEEGDDEEEDDWVNV